MRTIRTGLLTMIACILAAAAVQSAPRISVERVISAAPSVGMPCELGLNCTAVYDDPYDPQDITIDATMVTPKRSYSIPAFYYIPFMQDSVGVIKPAGAGSWRLRFLPTEPGQHTVTISVKDKSGRASSPAFSMNILQRSWKGLIRVSKHNPRLLMWENGETAHLMGFNVYGAQMKLDAALPTNWIDADALRIRRLAAGGGNFIRLRMDSFWYAIENPINPVTGYVGAGKFNQRACWDIDRLFSLCEETGVHIQLTFDNANPTVNEMKLGFINAEAFNTFRRTNGGTLDDMKKFWTDESTKEMYLRKLRYAVARWGASPSLAIWEVFNEVYKISGDTIPQWHDDMARALKKIDPHRRLVTTSLLQASDGDGLLWSKKNIDVVQYHTYNEGVYQSCRDIIERFPKPFFAAEFGVHGDFNYYKNRDLDGNAVMPHTGHWQSAMALSAIIGNLWFVENYTRNENYWNDFKRLQDFLRDIPFDDPSLNAFTAEPTQAPGIELPEAEDIHLKPPAQWNKTKNAEFAIARNGTITPPLTSLNGYLWGTKNHPELRNPPSFKVNARSPWRFGVRVLEVVGKGSNPVEISIDGEVKLTEDMVCEADKVVFNRTIWIDVPAGKHTIGVDNNGIDRALVEFMFAKYCTSTPVPEMLCAGLSHRFGVDIYILNRTWSASMLMGMTKHIIARDVRVTLNGRRDGEAAATWIDPMTMGHIRSEAVTIKNGSVTLSAGTVTEDIACRIRYR